MVLPVGIKDIIDTADLPTENGNRLDAGRRPIVDAILVARLRAAGAVVPGKTVTTECAYLAPARQAIRTIRSTRQAVPHPALRLRSPVAWCRSRSAPKPEVR